MSNITRSAALRFVLLLSAISLCSDIVYEGARSISGPFLGTLGASAIIVGSVSGFGELLGYGLRLISGRLADKTRAYWFLTITGYAINLLAIPILAFANNWELAALLLLLERTGKALRTPARDVMLSAAGDQLGPGFAFGLHGALDQIGAVTGPLLVAWAVATQHGFRAGFLMLVIPAVVALLLLFLARFIYADPHELSVSTPTVSGKGLDKIYWLYVAGACLIGAGFVDYPLIAYHIQRTGLFPLDFVAVVYSAAMASEALSGLAFGKVFDRLGLPVLAVAALLTAGAAPAIFLARGAADAWIGVALWGVGMGAQDAVMRATIAKLVPVERRGSAYGTFGLCFGISWFVGSALLGFLYTLSPVAIAVTSALLQLSAIPVILIVHHRIKVKAPG